MAKKNTGFQSVILKPLVGILDVRSNIDETPTGAFRWKQNFAISPDGKLSRALGWTRPFNITGAACPYRNWDWHDQGVASPDDREPITMMFQSTENDGDRRLFIGTKTKLAVLDEASGQYTILGSSFGNDSDYSQTQLRFKAAELQNKVYFTNDFDIPQYHQLDSGTIQAIPELATAAEGGGAITKARVIISWSGLIFLMNLVEDGTRYASRIRWSDLNDGTKWTVGAVDSISDYQDLDYGETILNAVPLAGQLYVFTDKSIWRCTPSINLGDPPSMELQCIKVYTEPKNRAKCLAYPNAIVSTGFEIYYAGSDGIYKYDPYSPQPERVEWLHRATAIMYKGAQVNGRSTVIDRGACESPIMEYVPGPNETETAGSGELHISWPVYDPLAVAIGGETGAIVCEELIPTPPVVGSGLNKHTLVLHIKHNTADYRDYGSTAMVNFTSQLLSGACAQQAMFLAANAQDYCIKLMNTGQSREFYDAEEDEYSTSGYYSVLRGVFPFEKFADDKWIESFLVGVIPDDPNETAVMRLRLGTSYQALDPNIASGRCSVLWHQLSNKQIKCRDTRTAAKYVVENVMPDDPVEWNFRFKGKFLYFEITLAKPDGSAPVSGGCQLSRFECRVKLA